MTDNYAPAHWRPSPNFSPGPRTIDMVLIHDTEGGYEGSIQYLALPSTQASAHYIVRSADGDISQMVHEADIAWHSGDATYNKRSIGIEHEGFLAQPSQWYTDAMLTASAQLVADICRRYNIPVDRQHIIGHQEVRNADGTLGGSNHHTDPGPGWPWDRYMQMVRDYLTGASLIKLDPDYPIYAPPTINLSIFSATLRNAGSPAYDEVEDCYQVCTDNGVNPAVALAFFAQESDYGNAPAAADRRNWGNLSTSGQITTYDTWALGLRDWCNHFRGGVYANRGLSTISQIVPVYQPSSASGTIVGYNTYIRGLYNLIKGWQEQMAGTVTFAPADATTASFAATADDTTPPDYGPSPDYGKALWRPSAYYSATDRAPIDMVIIHFAEGHYADTLNQLTSPQSPNLQSSLHYLVCSSNGEVTQMVKDDDTAWHAGNLAYNQRSIGVGHEGFSNEAAKWLTDTMLTASANLVAAICRCHNIPIDREHIIGHNEVPDPNNPALKGGAAHYTDPGADWPWDKYMQLVEAAAAAKDVKQDLDQQAISQMTADTTTDVTALPFGVGGGTPDSSLAQWYSGDIIYSNPRTVPINMVVIHDTEAPPTQKFIETVGYLVSVRPNNARDGDLRSSAHYAISNADGTIYQMIPEAQAAWHAGNTSYNNRSIGIEHELPNNADPATFYSDTMLQASAKLVADICTRHQITIDRQHIIGHNEVPDPSNPSLGGGAGHHQDPRGWPWERYIQMVQLAAGQPTTPGGAKITIPAPSPDYPLYATATMKPESFRQVLQLAGSPAFDEGADDLYDTCVAQGVNPAVALAFFKLESNYGNNDNAALKNWGNLVDHASGQLKQYASWKEGLTEWCNHFRIPPYSTDNLATISQIVPVYQPSKAGGTVAGYTDYVNKLHDTIKGWSDAEAAGTDLSFAAAPTGDAAPADPTATSFGANVNPPSSAEEDLEWVEGIGPTFERILAEHGIHTTQDLASATVAQLQATGINRKEAEFASWIQQAKERIARQSKGEELPFEVAATAKGSDGGAIADLTATTFAATADGHTRLADPTASDYPLIGPPSISYAEFAAVFLRHPESPLWQEASPHGAPQASNLQPYWDKILSYGVDPLIALSFFAHESTLGRDAAIAPRRNWGNLKRGGQYESFSTWLDGLDAWLRRLTGATYLGAGLTTIAKIVPVYAPAFENPGYYDDLINNYIHPFLNEDPQPVSADQPVLTAVGSARSVGTPAPANVPTPDYPLYGAATINLSLFRQTLQNAGSPAFDEVDACYDACTNAGVNPAVALAFFALESNYGTNPATTALKNWGNLLDHASGQLKQYATWVAGLAEWCNHFRIPPYSTDNLATISQIVPVYQPASSGGTIAGYNIYITRLHDLIKSWQDQLAAQGTVFAPQ